MASERAGLRDWLAVAAGTIGSARAGTATIETGLNL